MNLLLQNLVHADKSLLGSSESELTIELLPIQTGKEFYYGARYPLLGKPVVQFLHDQFSDALRLKIRMYDDI